MEKTFDIKIKLLDPTEFMVCSIELQRKRA